MEINWRAGRQKLANFKVIFDLFISCFYFIQQQKYKLYYVTLMIISEIQSKRAHWSFYSSKVKAPADFSHHAILATWISIILVQPRKTLPFITERLLMGRKQSNKQNNATYLSPLPSSFSLKKWVFNISPAGSRALRSWRHRHSSVSSVDQTLGPLDKSRV